MDLSASTLWWVAAGTLVALELGTGSLYLLMLALGAAAAALAAHAQAGATLQWVAASLVGGGATVAWHLLRRRTGTDSAHNPDVNIDIGQTVHVAAWNPDGTARVAYRGSQWPARHSGPESALPGAHRIVAVQGSELQLGRLQA
jgi:membrane protein implicated in regulation of membrane protease activity